MKKDYYKILEVDKNFTEDQLKKNYKKLCLKYHPDRLAGKSEEEKKAAEEKFKDIQEAYECLSDADKRAHYDRFGSMDNYGQGWSAGADMFSHFSDFFSDFDFPGFGGGFGNMFGGNRRAYQRGPEPGQSLRMQISVDIKTILDGGEKTFKFSRRVRCKSCNGEGGTGITTCPYCKGTGMMTTVRQSGFGIIQQSSPCTHCNGTGKTMQHKCGDCGGTGFKSVEETVTVKIPKHVENGHVEVLYGKGCESKDRNGKTGDLQVIMLHAYDTNKYIVQGNIVYEKIDVPYYDAILGVTLHRTAPNGQKITLAIPQCSHDGDNIFAGKVSGFDYRFILSVSLPKSITKDERKLLEKLRKK